MRLPVSWLIPLLATSVIAQSVVTICESYSITDVTTFTEYTTYYETRDGVVGTRSSTTPSGTLSRTTSTPGSDTFRSRTTLTRSSSSGILTTPMSSTSLGDPIIPSTSTSATSTSTSTSPASSSSTVNDIATTSTGSTPPSATESQFFVVFDSPVAKRRIIKRALLYLAFDEDSLSIIVSDQSKAVIVSLDQSSNMVTGNRYVTVNSAISPPRFALRDQPPDPPLGISINFGTVMIQGVDSYCLEPGNDLVLVTTSNDSASDTCRELRPQLVAASSSTTSTTTMNSPSTSTSSLSQTTVLSSTGIESSTSTTEKISTSTSEAQSTTTSITTTTATSLTESEATPSTTSSPTTTSSDPLITNKAYIDTVMRHHNAHRANHSVPALTWDNSLAETARKIADTCVYEHNTIIDCPSNAGGNGYSCYGQNIGAGYLPTQMGAIITGGFYNGEEPYFTYYGTEPDYDTIVATLHKWGHFSQIVWKDTATVGCYTQDCTDRPDQLGNIDSAATRIAPVFTVCNYGPPGNYLGEFKDNVLATLGQATVQADYMCPDEYNCENNYPIDASMSR